jgi:hypothetical protein
MPLVITNEQMDEALDVIESALSCVQGTLPVKIATPAAIA